jgi:hypothetical protein
VKRPRSAFAALAAVAALLAACGEDDPPPTPDEPPAELLAAALDNPPASGQVDLDGEVELDGESLIAGGVAVEASGPFAAAARDELPRFALAGEAEVAGFGVDGELISTGTDAFVVFFGENYQVGEERTAEAGARWSDFAAQSGPLGSQAASWFVSPRYGDAEEVDGTDAQRIDAELDGARAGADIAAIARAAGAPAFVEALAAGAGEGTAQAWVAFDDQTLRRLRVEFPFTVPRAAQASAAGVRGGTASFEVELSDLGEEVDIEPPPGGGFQPIEQLIDRIMSFASLGGL